MSVTSASAADEVKPASSTLNASVVTEPVTRVGRKAYDQVAGGMQWYVERWEDMVHEAKAARAPAQILSMDEVLSRPGSTHSRAAY